MSDGKKTFETGRSGVASCRALSHVLLDMFVERLEGEAAKTNAVPTIEMIRTIAEEFKGSESEAAHNMFLESAKNCLTNHEKEIWSKVRRNPFDRVLVHRFSRLFPPEGELDAGGYVSRRILPGFFLAFEKMVSPELHDRCQAACKKILKEGREKSGGDFDWWEMYKNDEITEMTNDVVMVIASHFNDFRKRRDWLIDLINSHLAPPDDYAFEGDTIAEWHLDEEGAMILLGALFSPFTEKLKSDEGRKHIEQRYGHNAYKAMGNLLLEISVEK